MADNDIATQASWNISCSPRAGGNKRLTRMVDYDVADDSETDTENEVGSEDPVGFTDKPGKKTITFNFKETIGAKPETDWHYLKASKEVIALTRQVKGGRRTQFIPARVSKVTEKGDKDGKHEYSVEVVALQRKAM